MSKYLKTLPLVFVCCVASMAVYADLLVRNRFQQELSGEPAPAPPKQVQNTEASWGSPLNSDGSPVNNNGKGSGSNSGNDGTNGASAWGKGSKTNSDGSTTQNSANDGTNGASAWGKGSQTNSDGSIAQNNGRSSGSNSANDGSNGASAWGKGSQTNADGSAAQNSGKGSGSNSGNDGSNGATAWGKGSKTNSDGSAAQNSENDGSNGASAWGHGSQSDGSVAQNNGKGSGSNNGNDGSNGASAWGHGSQSDGSVAKNNNDGGQYNKDFPPLTPTDEKMMPNANPPGMPTMPSQCAENSDCKPCYAEANAVLNKQRMNLEKVRAIYDYTHRFTSEGLDFMNGAAAAGGGIAQMGAAAETKKVNGALDEFDATVRSKNKELLGELQKGLQKMAVCEADYFDNDDWYMRYGEVYYQFMQARYSN